MSVCETFPIRIAAAASQVSERTLRRWLDTRVMSLRGNDMTTTGSGTRCGWSRNRIVQAALTEALHKSGMALSRASREAFIFSDQSQPGRAAAECFEHARTIFLVGPDGATVKSVTYGATLTDATNRGVCTVIVDMNKITQTVDAVLNNESKK